MGKIFEALKRSGTQDKPLDGERLVEASARAEERPGQEPEQQLEQQPEQRLEQQVDLQDAVHPEAPDLEAQRAPVLTATGAQIRTYPVQLAPGSPALPFDGVDRRAGEQYRVIRTKLLQHPKRPRIFSVTSPGPGDGKTVTATNIAGALALRSGARVVLLDADLRRSSVAGVLGLPQSPGMVDVLSGRCSLQEAMIQVQDIQNLYVIPAGQTEAGPTELLDSVRWRETCALLREEFRFVVVDAPPISGVADYDLIQACCDGTLVVVRPEHTNRALCFKALEGIPKEKLLGVVVNCVPEWFLWKTEETYYYSRLSKEPVANA